jgi:hypothetical protein
MNWCRLLVLACLVALAVSPITAQAAARLQIEITRDGSVMAKPELKLLSGGEGRLELNGELSPVQALKGLRERVTITPAVRDGEVALAFNIASGDRQLRPSMVISRDVRGSVEWMAADGQPIRLTVAWIQ